MNYFESQILDDVLIVKVNLSSATVTEAQNMKEKLVEDIDLNHKKIILDLSKCTYIDSTFLGAMVFSLKKARRTGGDIKLVIDADSYMRGLFNLSGISKVFKIYTSIDDAIQDKNTFIESSS